MNSHNPEPTNEEAVLLQLEHVGIVPVVTMDSADRANELADALSRGGLPVAEVTLRTPSGLDTIRRLSERGDMLVGAGTVVTADQVGRVVDAGAKFVVSPGFSREVVEQCHDLGVTVLPGIATASELQAAVALGLTRVKFFPAERLGGRSMIEAFNAPFPDVRFMPSGGVTADNMANYLASSSVFAVGGSWMVDTRLIEDRRFDQIARLCRGASEIRRKSVVS